MTPEKEDWSALPIMTVPTSRKILLHYKRLLNRVMGQGFQIKDAELKLTQKMKIFAHFLADQLGDCSATAEGRHPYKQLSGKFVLFSDSQPNQLPMREGVKK